MKSKAIQVLLVTTLPPGQYQGIWSGYEVVVTVANNQYWIETLSGIRGIDIPCTVVVYEGLVSVYTND